MRSTFQPVSADDREYAWRHAFSYADVHVATEEARMYADHYVQLVSAEDDMSHWPSHGPTFADWNAALEASLMA